VDLILSIEPIINDHAYHISVEGSSIQVQLPEKTWLYQCREKPEEVNKKRVAKLKELNNVEANDGRFDLLDIR